MQSPGRSFLSPSGNGEAPNLRAVMGAALDAYLWTERQRAEEANELGLDIKKLCVSLQECANAAQQQIQEEVAQLSAEMQAMRESLTHEVQALRETQASDTAKLREMCDSACWRLREQSTTEMAKLREHLQMETRTLREEVSRAYATRSDLQSARAGLEASLSSCRSELTANRSDLERAKAELQSLRSELGSARKDLESQDANLGALKTEQEKHLASLEVFKGDFHSTKSELAVCRSDLAACRNDLSSFSASLSSCRSDLEALRPPLMALQSRSESHDAELSMQRKDLEALQKELWALKGDVEVSFTKANKELANLQKDLSETRIQSGDHARGLAETKQQLGDTRQELAATQRSVTAVQKDASTTQGQLTLLQQEVSCNLSGAISGLQKDTLSLQSTTGEMRQEALKAQSFAKELEKDALAMQGRVNTLQQETSETKSVTAGLRQALEELQGTVRELQKGASQSQTHISDLRKEASDAQTHLGDLKKAILEARNSTSELRRDLVKTQSHQTTEVRQEVEKTRSVAQELRKDLTLTFQLEVANVRKELCQKEETLNGEIAAASARAKEQLSNEIRKVTNEVQQMWQQSHHAEQMLKEEVLQLTHGMRRAEEEAEELRAEVHEACTAIEENRQEVDAHLSLRISEVQQSLQAEFKVADANLHTEVATAAANDRYNLGVEMERLRGDLGQGGLLRSSVAQAQELASRAGAHEVIATLRVEQLFSPAPAACDYEFPLLASRCMVRLKPNRKEFLIFLHLHQTSVALDSSSAMAPAIEDSREGERPQVPYSLEVASYAEIFQEGEPYLLDLFAATCWDAGETPTVETARQFWEHVRAQNPSPLPPPGAVMAAASPPGDAERSAGVRSGTAASLRPSTPRRPTKPWSSEDRLSFRSLRFGAAAASCLALQLKGRNVTRIDLGNNQLGDNAAAAIASLIHALPKLKSLLLAGNILGPAGVKEIATSELESNETLEHLALGEPKRQRPNYVTTEGLQALLHSLARNARRKMASLELSCTALRADAGKALADFLETDSVLASLDVSGNCFTSEGISTLLPACAKLKRLDIAETSCRGELIHAKLCDLLQKTEALAELSIAFNLLEPRPLRRIARALSSCAPLLTLNMASTGMETEGVIALADGLVNSQVSNLRDLDISENNISEIEAAVHVAKIIAQTKLQSLRLNRNPLGDAGVCELADALGSEPCPPLHSLELGSCRVAHLGASMMFMALRENPMLLTLRLSDNLLDDMLDITLIEALHHIQQLHLDSNRLSHRKLSKIAELCARNRHRVRTKEPRALGKQIKSLLPQEAMLKQHKLQAAKDSAEVFARVSAQSIAGEELRQLRLGMMKSAKQTEQKIATLEATLLQRRDYLDSIKDALAETARACEIEIAEKTEVLMQKENQLSDLQARVTDLEAQLARRRAQHPKLLAEIREEISAALPKTEELKAQEEEMRRELKALQDKSLIGFKP